jgi:hypothetical protein
MSLAAQIHHTNPKTQFWHNSGNVKKLKQSKIVFLAILMLMLLGSSTLQSSDHFSGIYKIYKPSGQPQEGRTTSKFGKLQ